MLQGQVPAGCLAVDDKEGRKRLGGCSRTSWLRHCGRGCWREQQRRQCWVAHEAVVGTSFHS